MTRRERVNQISDQCRRDTWRRSWGALAPWSVTHWKCSFRWWEYPAIGFAVFILPDSTNHRVTRDFPMLWFSIKSCGREMLLNTLSCLCSFNIYLKKQCVDDRWERIRQSVRYRCLLSCSVVQTGATSERIWFRVVASAGVQTAALPAPCGIFFFFLSLHLFPVSLVSFLSCRPVVRGQRLRARCLLGQLPQDLHADDTLCRCGLQESAKLQMLAMAKKKPTKLLF